MNKAKLDIQQFAPEPASPDRYYLSLNSLEYLLNEKIIPDMALRELESNKVTTINSSSTDKQYPSAKCVYDLVEARELESNKVTTINSSSTDKQYPSAKCVYNLIGNVESLLETLDVGSGV